jgi:hypothetical protein
MTAVPRAVATLIAVLAASACGDRSLEKRKEVERAAIEARIGERASHPGVLTETEKVELLIERVRASGHTFVRNDKEHSSKDAAEHLTMKFEAAGDRIKTAQEFIKDVASRSSLSGKPYFLRTADGTEHLTRDWLSAQLREIEKPPPRPVDAASAGEGEATPSATQEPTVERVIDVEFVLHLIEESELTFYALKEEKEPTKYNSGEFSRMLRRKWSWLGPDIEQLDPWLDEIATRSFKSNLPYEVRLANEQRVELRPWLDGKLRVARKQGEP